MNPNPDPSFFDSFINQHIKQAIRCVPARLQAVIALLERLRDFPSLSLGEHESDPGSSGIKSHETFGDTAHRRLKIQAINKNHGRRSCNLRAWGQQLLDLLRDLGFAEANNATRGRLIDHAQGIFAEPLRKIIEQDPLEARLRDRTAEAVINEVLLAAEEKGKSGDVAQYLVGAKLALRFNRDIPVYPANKSDRTSHRDTAPRLGDFEIENAVIEVAVGTPDDKHLQQVAEILENSAAEVWLLTRSDRVAAWQNELKTMEGVDTRRVVVTSVAAFVGQNITELGEFSAKRKAEQLRALFALYNDHWVAQVGTPGIRIVVK